MYERLRDYQKSAVAFALTQRGVGLFCDPRTGKTWIALAIAEQLEPQDILAVVPLTNKFSTWAKWIREFLPEYELCTTLEEFKAARNKKRFFLAHYEQLPGLAKKLQRVKWGLVILDESQRIKARASGQSRNLRRFRHVEHRVALSGTPMDDSEIDLWGQMRFIEPTALSERWSDFDERFLTRTGFMGYGRKFRSDRKEEFYQSIKPYCLRVTRDVADIPEPTLHWCEVNLFGRQRRIYDDLEQDWLVTIDRIRIEAAMEITKRVKLQQIVNGFIFDEDKGVYEVGRAKLRKLRYLLTRRLTQPAVIFCQYLPEVDMIREECLKFSSRVAVLTGAVKDKGKRRARTDLLEAFQRGEIDYLICQQKTGGVGIDLFRARNGVMFSFNESWIDFDQTKSRMDLPGVEPPDLFLIVARNTIDDAKREAVMFKRTLTEVVLNKFKRR